MKKKAKKAGKAKASRKRSATKDLGARKAVKGGILPYIEQGNIVTAAGPGGGPHVIAGAGAGAGPHVKVFSKG